MTVLKSITITCDGSAHTLASVLGDTAQAKWYQFLAAAANSDDVKIGGSDVAAEGFPLVKGSGFLTPVNSAEEFNLYAASGLHYFGTNGDILYVLYAIG